MTAKKRRLKILFAIHSWAVGLSLVLLPDAISAQEFHPTIWFDRLTKEDGLNNEDYLRFFRDSDGFMWIYSISGLNRFDGKSLTNYPPEVADSTALASERVNGEFFEDSRRNLWFCTLNAIQCYRRKSDDFKRFFLKNENGQLETGEYIALFLEKDSILWVRSNDKQIYRFNLLTQKNSAPVGKVFYDVDITAAAAPDGALNYLFSMDGSKSAGLEVLAFDKAGKLPSRKVFFDGKTGGQPVVNVHSLVFENERNVWLGTTGGILQLDLKTGNFQNFPTGRNNPVIVKKLDAGTLFVRESKEGIFIFDKKRGLYRRIDARLRSFPESTINGLLRQPYLDRDSNLWLLVDNDGLIFANLSKTKFDALPKTPLPDGAKNYAFRTIIEDANGHIWCSTFFNGIFHFDANGKLIEHFYRENPKNNLPFSNQINHMLLDRAGNLWIATHKSVGWYDPVKRRFGQITDAEGRPVPYVVFLYQLKNGKILASTMQEGVFELVKNGGRWVLSPRKDIDPAHSWLFISEDENGKIYLSRDDVEILVMSNENDRLKKMATLPIQGTINGFSEEKNQAAIWIATSNGLYKINKNDLRLPPENVVDQQFAKEKNFQSMATDGEGNLWLGGLNGLFVYQKTANTFRQFSLSDGMQSIRFDQLAVLKKSNGDLWFGGENGITIVRPNKIRYLSNLPKCKITGVKINDEERRGLSCEKTGATNVSEIGEIALDYRDNTLSFDFVAIEYADPSANQLAYKMERADDHWVYLPKGETGFARYSNLPPDRYVFKIKGANSDGVWNEQPLELIVRIRPPFWQTWWFQLTIALFAAAAGYVLYRYRVRQIREKAELKTRIAENKMAALRAQMNPHFIFNSLHSINSFILRQDMRNASEYLTQFAKLIRMILEHSRQATVSLEKEIEILELYMKAEAKRLKNPFTYTVQVDERLDTFDTQVPSIMLQPFIENAVWHGLSHRETAGHIFIGFYKENGSLKCVVEDNGVGRAKAAELKAQKGKGHQSRAMQIIEERLQLLYSKEKGDVNIRVIDLLDDHRQPAGTRVEISFPFMD